MSVLTREVPSRFTSFYPQPPDRKASARLETVAAAHCDKLDGDSVLDVLSMAVDGLDDRTLKAWLSPNPGVSEGAAQDSLTVLKMVVGLLGAGWESFPPEHRHVMLEIGSRAVVRVNAHMSARFGTDLVVDGAA